MFDSLRNDALEQLQGLLKQVLDRVDNWLFDALRKSPTYTPLLDAAKVLRARRNEFEAAYRQEVIQAFAALQGCIRPDPSGELELSLIDDEALQELLTSESMVAALETALAMEFDVIARRLAVMAGRPSLKAAHNPLSAARLASALQGAQRACPMPDAMRTALFKIYEAELIAELPTRLQPLNRRLSDAGILPNLDRPPEPAEALEEDGPPLPATQVYMPENAPGVDVRESFNFLRGLLHRLRPNQAPVATGLDDLGLDLPDLRRALDEGQAVAILSSMQPTLPAAVLGALSDSGAIWSACCLACCSRNANSPTARNSCWRSWWRLTSRRR